MKILLHIRDALGPAVAAAAPDAEVITVPREGDVAPEVRGEVLLTYPWGGRNLAQVLDRGVRWVHALGTGIDAFPLELLTDQILTCSRGGSAVPIAEWALAMMLAFEKQLPETWIHGLPPQGWHRAALGTLLGKTLGLVGFGGIGAATAQRALSFGMHVVAHRRTAASPGMAGVELARSLPALLAASDHVVIAAPSTRATRHLFNRETFAHMKPGAHLINVARGALVDQDALRAALDDGRIAMASLDTVEPEPLPKGHWLFTHPHVRLSAHVSWSVPGAVERLLEPFIENLRRYRTGAPLIDVVDREAGY